MNKLILFLPILLLSCSSPNTKKGYKISTYSSNGEIAKTYVVSDYEQEDNGIYIMVAGEKKKVTGSFKIEKFHEY